MSQPSSLHSYLNGHSWTLGGVVLLIGYAIAITGWAYTVYGDTKLNRQSIYTLREDVAAVRRDVADMRRDYNDKINAIPTIRGAVDLLEVRMSRIEDRWERGYYIEKWNTPQANPRNGLP